MRSDDEFEVAVVEQDPVADDDLLGERVVADVDALGSAPLDAVAGQHERSPIVDLGSVGDPPEADLGPLEVLHHGHDPPDGGGLLADDLDHPAVVVVTAVREVEPGHVHAGPDQGADALAGGHGRAERADDFGAARGRARHGWSVGGAANLRRPSGGDSPNDGSGFTRVPRALERYSTMRTAAPLPCWTACT